MQNINDYILEKLKIDKSVSIKQLFKEDVLKIYNELMSK